MKIKEQILIVHSVEGTLPDDLQQAQEAISFFSRVSSSVKATPLIFKIPAGVAPGVMLPTELYEQLSYSIGAIVFVDDLKPNITYELGFFHGQGRRVLLITKKPINDFWLATSDLAGAPLAMISEGRTIKDHVEEYLTRLYDDLALADLWESISFPSAKSNIINTIIERIDPRKLIDSEFGKSLSINQWSKYDVHIEKNVLPDAKFIIILRAKKPRSLYSIYFHVKYSDKSAEKKEVWIGLSSVKRMINFQSDERLVPSENATRDWLVIQGSFEQLFKRSSILGKIIIESIHSIRFRAGSRDDQNNSDIEIGYLNIIGLK